MIIHNHFTLFSINRKNSDYTFARTSVKMVNVDIFNIQYLRSTNISVFQRMMLSRRHFYKDMGVCLGSCVFIEIFSPSVSLAVALFLGVKAREPPCSRGDEMLRQRKWTCVCACVYRCAPVRGSGSPLSPSRAVEQK